MSDPAPVLPLLLHLVDRARDLASLTWLTTKEAAEYTRRPSVRAFYVWRDRHFIKPAALYRRTELDQAIERDNRRVARGRGRVGAFGKRQAS